MKVSLRNLKALVREAALTAASVSAGVGLIVRESRGYVTMALVMLAGIEEVLTGVAKTPKGTLSRAIVGGITAGEYDVWRVTNVRAEHGHGPMLYRLAMQYATRRGSALSSDPDGHTSPDAQRVWDRFAEQPDVEVVFLDEEHGDQRDVAYRLEGDDSTELARRYADLLSQYDRSTVGRLDELLDEAIGEAVATFGN